MFKRHTKKLDRENFFLDLISIDWPKVLQLENEDPNLSFEKYFTTINKHTNRQIYATKKMPPKEVKQQRFHKDERKALQQIFQR